MARRLVADVLFIATQHMLALTATCAVAGRGSIMTDTPRAVVMVVDEDPQSLARVRYELEKRYAADYDIVSESSPAAALETLRGLADSREPVAIVLADLRLQEMSGPEFLGRVTALHPTARRGLTVTPWEDRVATMSMMIEILARGAVDYFVIKPTDTAFEHFHRLANSWKDHDQETGSGPVMTLSRRFYRAPTCDLRCS
jgi:response regulator RpfG family c-di-GMP phosphodiesterase